MESTSDYLIQIFGVLGLSIAGVILGIYLSSLKSTFTWLASYGICLAFIGIMVAIRFNPEMEFKFPWQYLVAGRTEYALMGAVTAVLFTMFLTRLNQPREKLAIVLMIMAFIFYFSVLPFTVPAIMRNSNSELTTIVDHDGVCLQSNSYNCGPAAAVTVLRKRGIKAEEGELAINAFTTPFSGTPVDLLRSAITNTYEIPCKAEYNSNLFSLREKVPFIAVVKFNFFVDHYVAVLKIDGNTVTIGDPLHGLRETTVMEFDQDWRNAIISF